MDARDIAIWEKEALVKLTMDRQARMDDFHFAMNAKKNDYIAAAGNTSLTIERIRSGKTAEDVKAEYRAEIDRKWKAAAEASSAQARRRREKANKAKAGDK